jgi:hypothetical protein
MERTHCSHGHDLRGAYASVVALPNRKIKVDCRVCNRIAARAYRKRRGRRGPQPISNPPLLVGLIEIGYPSELVARWAHVRLDRLERAIEFAVLEVRS